MKHLFLTLIVILSPLSYTLAKDDDTPKSSLTSGDIIDTIDSERDFLRGKFKVNLVERLLSKSNAQNIRYGNKKRVLNLRGISLGGEDLSNTIFNMANMAGANLSGADLSGADLIHVDFTGANLRDANFTGADLSNAIFENTQIDGAIFDGANLFNATFIKMNAKDPNLIKKLKSKSK